MNQVFLFKKKKPINHEALRHEVNTINTVRKSAGQKLVKKIKIRCSRKGSVCKIFGLFE